ncbi:seminal plasma protein A3-like [Oryx dammah]|uniref:seminal plasma protein A3-like n=1 Tax=Oryx dammah TaxID=59534 RepID=UPI001A9B7463|nr:seminal plasma protein A3-like [Oryx dammah]
MALRLGLFLIWAGVSVILQLHSVNGDQQLSGDDFILPKEKKDSASGAETKGNQQRKRMTTSHNPVQQITIMCFPFTYGNRKHLDCTSRGSISPWCSLDADYSGRWKFCAERDYAKCVFPFICEGKSFNTCTTIGSITMSYWCTLSPNYDQDRV